ncbi:MAG: L-fuculose phosphate aldolase [Alphaproteobacteria bacterium MarineAlpha6_Bin2]|jgi:L-fuculose-phosphate aldolase|nr:MAG: L-fuculose phosphate aldolase [Alphaproteobacteria bacterium MarineAlpha6_Bin2]
MKTNELIKASKYLNDKNINRGSSGNLSFRSKNGFIITPSSLPNDKLTEKNCVQMNLDGTYQNKFKPSTEWKIHRDIYVKRKDIYAIIHTHPISSTAIACMNINIPAFHYMIAVAGGDNIRCAKYATFGTEQLSKNVLKALENRNTCLMANHGLIVIEKDLKIALKLTEEVENLSMQFLQILKSGKKPVLLSKNEMKKNIKKIKNYNYGKI